MPDPQRTCSPQIAPSWSSESLKSEPLRVVRRFINPAVYVEKQIMPPLRKKSSLCGSGLHPNNESDGGTTNRTISSDRSVKRCTCITSPKTCPCHPSDGNPTPKEESPSSSSSDAGSQITVKSKRVTSSTNPDTDTNLSLSLHSEQCLDEKEKGKVLKSWMHKKDAEKRQRELQEERRREAEQKKRELVREQEKENFQRWLIRKKDKEEAERKEEERRKEEEKSREIEKERKQRQTEASYQSWLRRKKRVELERKIKEKLALLQLYEEKQKRLEENEQAFMKWFENSKSKPKPVPFNQGLKSLCSSTSVTYINPAPWIPNIELVQKPASQ